MREIKFRVWDKTRKKLFQVVSIDFVLERVEIWVSTIATILSFNKIEIMQYTSLLDKELNEIYEDDLLDVDYPNGTFLARVVYELGSFHIVAVKGSIIDYLPENWNDNVVPLTSLHWEQDCTDGNAIDSVKIVGNIHENTSLLEVVE